MLLLLGVGALVAAVYNIFMGIKQKALPVWQRLSW